MHRSLSLALLLIVGFVGCGAMPEAEYKSAGAVAEFAPTAAPAMDRAEAPTSETAGRYAEAPQDAPPPGVNLARKIIYDAQINVLIADLDESASKLVDLVAQAGGYVAEQNLAGSPGTERTGRWKVRVPVEKFEGFVQSVLALGELELNQRTSQDVTEQFYDVEARVKNKKVEEQTLLKILEERGGKLEDVLKVEVELSRVRGEIEQLEGRLRVLANLSSLATVTINLRERRKYEPPAPVAATFKTRIGRAWADSLAELRRVGENLLLGAVALAPWLPLYLVGFVVAFLAARWAWRAFVRNSPRMWAAARRPILPAAHPHEPPTL
jgi:hypothetical protein